MKNMIVRLNKLFAYTVSVFLPIPSMKGMKAVPLYVRAQRRTK